MSFIAAVTARKGVAIIADSLEKPELPVARLSDPFDRAAFDPVGVSCLDQPYIGFRDENDEAGLLLSPAERLYVEQFHTEDHSEKIFQFDRFTALIMIGITSVNDKSMGELIEEFKETSGNTGELAGKAPAKLGRFCNFLNAQIRVHLDHYKYIGRSVLILTCYDHQTMHTHICRIRIREYTYDCLGWCDSFVSAKYIQDKIVCYGQYQISRSILRGFDLGDSRSLPQLVKNVLKRLRSPDQHLPGKFIHLITTDPFYRFLLSNNLKTINISDLSLQKAIDLASLLMRLEVDYFTLTRTSPKVGGAIQLAAIDGGGFQFVR